MSLRLAVRPVSRRLLARVFTGLSLALVGNAACVGAAFAQSNIPASLTPGEETHVIGYTSESAMRTTSWRGCSRRRAPTCTTRRGNWSSRTARGRRGKRRMAARSPARSCSRCRIPMRQAVSRFCCCRPAMRAALVSSRRCAMCSGSIRAAAWHPVALALRKARKDAVRIWPNTCSSAETQSRATRANTLS
jgi:hypothetical protein